ncbi:MAG: hypothetical protein K2Q20_04235, partial [Phycisphaerales bacterium]|nr:hypothetical protein [Phycisphaerales bacterium]
TPLGQLASEHHQLIELVISAFTLGVSFWIAFGPLRHRLPRFITRFAKLSAVLKLLALAGLCIWGLVHNIRFDDSLAMRWLLGVLTVVLLAGAAFVATRRPVPKPPAGGRTDVPGGTAPGA